MSGRAIRIFLVDGTPTGLRTAEIGLSTIKGLDIPRSLLDAFSKREESRKTGLYVLIGEDPEIPGRLKIYIGEGDEVLPRVLAHDKDATKDFWDRVVVFVSKDQNLTKAHVRHLEGRLVELASRAKRCTVDNKTTPIGGGLPEADLAEMEEFLDQVRLLLATLGVNAFEAPSVAAAIGPQPAPQPVLTLRLSGDGYDAKCDLIDGEFVVLNGSTARLAEAPSLGPSSRAARAELVASGVLLKTDIGLVFAQDYAFGSASGSAQVIVGANVNGRTAWKLENGTPFSEWQEKQLAPSAATVAPAAAG